MRILATLRLLTLMVLVGFLAAGCLGDGDNNDNDNDNGGGGDGGAAATRGSINLQVSGLDDIDADPDVTVTGPGDNAQPQALSEGDNDGFEPGDYSVTVNDVDDGDGNTISGTADPTTATVTAGETTDLSVAYGGAQPPQAQASALWVPVVGNASVQGFTPSDLTTSGTTAPGVANLTGATIPNATAFDSDGNLWVADLSQGGRLLMYTPAQLQNAADGNPPASASVTITANTGADPAAQLAAPAGLAFGPNGTLWVSNFGAAENGATQDSLIGYSSDQLASTGSPNPAFLIEGTDGGATTLDDPRGMAFNSVDPDADNIVLWVANAGSSTVGGYSASTLRDATNDGNGTTQIAPVFIDSSNGSVDTPFSIAFDADGNLWVANTGSANNLVEFSQDNLPQDDSAVAADATVTIADGSTGTSVPNGLAFDADGNLWVADGGNNRLVQISQDDLSDGNTATPARSITGFTGGDDPGSTLGGADSISFNPRPDDLPFVNTDSTAISSGSGG